MADAGKEQVAAGAPDQQPGEGDRLGVPFDVAIGLLARQLAEHRAFRVAGSIDQQHQRQRDTEGDAVQDAQCQLSGDDDRGDAKFPMGAGEQAAQIAGPRKVKHCRDHDGGECWMRHAPE